MSLPRIASRDEWLAARSRPHDEGEGPHQAAGRAQHRAPRAADGGGHRRTTRSRARTAPSRLLDLFEGRPQLIVYHFMFHPEWEDGCPSCTAGVRRGGARVPRAPAHPRHHLRARVPGARSRSSSAGRTSRAGSVPWYSTNDGDFSYDFGATDRRLPRLRRVQLPHARRVRGAGARSRMRDCRAALRHARPELLPAGRRPRSSTPTRCTTGASRALGGSYYFLDNTALGRQEDWEEPKGRSDSRADEHARLRDLRLGSLLVSWRGGEGGARPRR